MTTPAGLSVLDVDESSQAERIKAHKPSYQILDEETYEVNIKGCQIRPDKVHGLGKRAEPPWDAEVSIFKEYLKEAKGATLDRCFEKDWEARRGPRFRPPEKEPDVKEYMRGIYGPLKEVYRIAAATEPTENVPCIGSAQCKWLVGDIWGAIALDKDDSGKLKQKQMDDIFGQVSSPGKGAPVTPTNPKTALVRH